MSNLEGRIEKLEDFKVSAAALDRRFLGAINHSREPKVWAREERRVCNIAKRLLESGHTELAQYVETSDLLARYYAACGR